MALQVVSCYYIILYPRHSLTLFLSLLSLCCCLFLSLSLSFSLSLSLSVVVSFSLLLKHTEPGDYTNNTPVTLSFPAGMTDTTRTVMVPTLDDNIKEADETIICTITILDSGGQRIDFPNGNSATITILDNDGESIQ